MIAFIKEKRSIEQEIEMITEEKRTERLIVSLCPFLILAVFNTMGTSYLDILYNGIIGRTIMTIAGILFFLSSYLAKRILEVRV
jgi:Flp pilus assembly protein TadB